MLASLPKFPSTGNPISNPARAIERRNYVLGRMLENHFIDKTTYDQAHRRARPRLPARTGGRSRCAVFRRDGAPGSDRATRQRRADRRLCRQDDARFGAPGRPRTRRCAPDLVTYDRRHGYRGAEAHVDLAADSGKPDWDKALLDYHALSGLVPGLVTRVDASAASVYMVDGQTRPLDLAAVDWARRQIDERPPRRGAQARRRRAQARRHRAYRANDRPETKDKTDKAGSRQAKRPTEQVVLTRCRCRSRVRRARSRGRRDRNAGRRFQLPAQQVQPRHAEQPLTRLGFQAIPLFRRVRTRLHAGLGRQRRAARVSRSVQAERPVDAEERRRQVPGSDSPARSAGQVGESRFRARARRDRRALRARIHHALRLPARNRFPRACRWRSAPPRCRR